MSSLDVLGTNSLSEMCTPSLFCQSGSPLHVLMVFLNCKIFSFKT